MRKITVLFAVLFLSTISVVTHAQVKGKVTDSKDGTPVEGASVKVKGTNTGVSTSSDGTFELNAKSGAMLVVSSTGYEAKEVKASANMGISLRKDVRSLTEVVVTALGQTKNKARVGYSTATFNSDAVMKSSPVSMLDALQGKIAGADITSVTGSPGGSSKVILRGIGIIGGGNNQPLYVIDGVPLSDARLGSNATTNGGNFDYGNGMSYVNPADIESISILRGTDASVMYGSSAKNGAIIITTKKGKAGKLKIEINSGVSFSKVGKLPTYQKEFGQGWDGFFYYPENGSWGPRLDGKMRLWGNVVDNSQLLKPFSYVGIKDFYETGNELNNSIGLSGGNENNNFYFSYGNVHSDGVLPSSVDVLNRNTFSIRTNSKFEKVTLNTAFNYVNRNVKQPSTASESGVSSSSFEDILQIPVDMPITDFKHYDNKFFNVDNYFTCYAENPYYILKENGSIQNTDRFFGNLDLGYKFTNKLSAQLRLGGDFANARTNAWTAVNAPSPGSNNDGGNEEGQKRSADLGSYNERTDYAGLINSDLIIKYTEKLTKDIGLDLLVGSNYYQSSTKGLNSKITGLLIPKFYNLSNTLNSPVTANYNSRRRRIGVYGEAGFNYKTQLYLTVQARNDWSSTLPDNKPFFYPGVNASWVVSNTFSLSNTPVSSWKLRAAYGKTGSDPDPYQVYSTLTAAGVGLGFGNITFPFNGVGAYEVSNIIGSASLKPIISKELELGTELKLFKNRVGIDFSYYDKKTDGQIFAQPISPGTGYTSMINNIGLISNKGIELTLSLTPISKKNFTWDIVYTYAKNSNKVEKLSSDFKKVILNSAYDAEYDAIPGRPVGTFLAPVPKYTADGKMVVDALTGFPVVSDVVNDSYGSSLGVYGTSQRDFMMGIVNTFTYKSFSLSFNLDWRQGGKFYSGTSDLVNFTGNSIATVYNDRKPFIIPNSVNEVSAGVYEENKTFIAQDKIDDYYYHTNNKAMAYNNRIIDRSFLKLRDLSLSYSLPKSLITKAKLNDVVFSVFAKNILLWTPKSNVYIDPEASNFGNDLGSEFGEFRTGPTTYQTGLSLKIGL